jgi:hypothetical protein
MRSVACLVLLIAFGAALLPAYSVSAEEQVVVIPKEELQVSLLQRLWRQAKYNYDTSPSRQIEELISTEIFLKAYAAGRADEIEQLTASFSQKYRAATSSLTNPSHQTLVLLGLSQAATMPGLKREMQSIAGSLLSNDELPVDMKEQIATGITAYFQVEISRHEAEQARRAVRQARQDPQFATRYDQVNKERLGASITELDDVGRFIRDHPDAAVPPSIVRALRPDGSVALSLQELNELARSEFGKINASIDDLQTTVDSINAKQDVLLDYVLDQRARQEAQALAEAKAQEHRLKLQIAGSAVTIISTLAGYIDPERGKQISVVGSSLIQIADAYTSWTKAVAGLGTLDALTSLSTAAMTGNVISAVLNVVSLFGPAQPTPEQMILEEIGKLRQQVSQLRTEMHDRFDRVDAQLNTIYTTLQDRFDKIDLRLGKIDGNVQEIQQTLVRLDQTLSRMERNSFEFLDASSRRPLLNAINGGLGYRERTGRDMPYQPDFVQYENDFHSWGTLFAFDPLSAGPTQRDYSDTAVLAELSAYPLDVNINYLNGWLVAHGHQPFANKRLPGPRDWLFASRAYAQLGLEWPAHIAQITPERQAALDAVGRELEQAMRNISTRQTPAGPLGNDVLFDEVLANYAGQIGAFDADLQATQAAFVQQHASALGRSALFDLYGGVEQRVNHTPAEMTTMTCGNAPGYGNLPAPHNLKNIVPDYDLFVLADYLQAKALKVCLDGRWLDTKVICSGSLCQPYAFHQAIIRVAVGGLTVARWTIDMPEREVATKQALVRTLEGWNAGPFYQRLFEEQFANATPTPTPNRDAILSATQQELARLQGVFEGRVRSEMASGSLKDAALRLAGGRKLVESFVALGMPQALANDDLMRSLVYSNQALIGDQDVIAAYSRAINLTPGTTGTVSDVDLTINPRNALIATANKRYQALGQLLTRYTDAITARTYSEPINLIGNTRLRMDLALTLAGIEPMPGGNLRRLYLPLIRR